MNKTLDFNKIKKSYLTITLADEEKTTLQIGTPTKSILDDLTEFQSIMDDYDSGDQEIAEEVINNLYTACAKVMSKNKGHIKITQEKLEDIFDIEDIFIFFNNYMNFINGIVDQKN